MKFKGALALSLFLLLHCFSAWAEKDGPPDSSPNVPYEFCIRVLTSDDEVYLAETWKEAKYDFYIKSTFGELAVNDSQARMRALADLLDESAKKNFPKLPRKLVTLLELAAKTDSNFTVRRLAEDILTHNPRTFLRQNQKENKLESIGLMASDPSELKLQVLANLQVSQERLTKRQIDALFLISKSDADRKVREMALEIIKIKKLPKLVLINPSK